MSIDLGSEWMKVKKNIFFDFNFMHFRDVKFSVTDRNHSSWRNGRGTE